MAEEDIFTRLEHALRSRVAIIADHAWRDRDPAAHLNALRHISEQIVELQSQLPSNTSPALMHYLQRSSYTKALAYLESSENKQPTQS